MGVVSKNRGILPPKWMVYIMENPIFKWMIWGVSFPLFFGSTPIYGSGYRFCFSSCTVIPEEKNITRSPMTIHDDPILNHLLATPATLQLKGNHHICLSIPAKNNKLRAAHPAHRTQWSSTALNQLRWSSLNPSIKKETLPTASTTESSKSTSKFGHSKFPLF